MTTKQLKTVKKLRDKLVDELEIIQQEGQEYFQDTLMDSTEISIWDDITYVYDKNLTDVKLGLSYLINTVHSMIENQYD